MYQVTYEIRFYNMKPITYSVTIEAATMRQACNAARDIIRRDNPTVRIKSMILRHINRVDGVKA